MNCETRTRGKLCGREECKPCFERSFASCDKAKYLAEGQENPLLVARCSTKKLKFDCQKCGHSFETVAYSVSAGCWCPFCSNDELCTSECDACFEKSFASHKKAEFWNFEKNKWGPREVFLGSNKKFWFKCGDCVHSFEAVLNDVLTGQFCPYCSNRKLCPLDDCKTCFRKSFASSDKARFWSVEKNKQTPREVFMSSGRKFWFGCGICGHLFQKALYSVSTGCWCPFCSNDKLCPSDGCKTCFEKSFASHKKAGFWNSEKNKQTSREVFSNSNKKFWFLCGECKHEFEANLNNISSGYWCPFCSSPPKNLCSSSECKTCFEKSFASSEKAEFWDFEKNEQRPREVFASSHKKFWFECENKHIFSSSLGNVSYGYWCPLCKNKTEAKLFSFLQQHFKDPVHQLKVWWCKNPETNKFLPFDFCVSKTIIELDGRQHYEQVMGWQSPELTQKNDRYKEEQALKNGYSVLRILQEDVWNDRIDWKSLLLEHIKDYETPVVKNLWEVIEEQQK